LTHEADELMVVEKINKATLPTQDNEVWVSADSTESQGMSLGLYDSFDFLDYRVKLLDISTDERKAEIAIYYIGSRDPYFIGQATLQQEGWGSETDAAITQARFGPIVVNKRNIVERRVTAVEYPFWVTLEYLGSGSEWQGNHFAELTPHRVLKAGETFFVDGAEYDVAAIYLPLGEFKYITIRNPIPKCEADPCDVTINDISVIKKAVRPWDSDPIWVLPPFNHEHDRVDDVDIPDCVQGDPNGTVYPDEQYRDNYSGSCQDGPTYLDTRYDTIRERILPYPEPALEMWWTDEDKEMRFDTNLLEEKFTEPEEEWRWINIETRPWHYTEFLLPDVADVAGSDGDYILVSSLLTEDSFVACVPAEITLLTKTYDSQPEPAQENEPINFLALVKGDRPYTTKTWTFEVGDTAEGLSVTHKFDEPGTYEVFFLLDNGCEEPAVEGSVEVEVDPCLGDFNDDNTRDTVDIGMMVPAWNTSEGDPEYVKDYDLDEDGDIDLADIMQVVAVWMTDCPYMPD
jgi:hypothetical protein